LIFAGVFRQLVALTGSVVIELRCVNDVAVHADDPAGVIVTVPALLPVDDSLCATFSVTPVIVALVGI
jgi:hypothetical protein